MKRIITALLFSLIAMPLWANDPVAEAAVDYIMLQDDIQGYQKILIMRAKQLEEGPVKIAELEQQLARAKKELNEAENQFATITEKVAEAETKLSEATETLKNTVSDETPRVGVLLEGGDRTSLLLIENGDPIEFSSIPLYRATVPDPQASSVDPEIRKKYDSLAIALP